MRARMAVISGILTCILFMGGDAMALMIKSPAFKYGDTMPLKYTCKGQNISPPLFWEQPPVGTQSFAIICEDPDAPAGVWSHWVIYNILKGTTKLSEGIPKYDLVENGAKQGVTDFREIGYGGPCPPPGTEHRYFFRLYALDRILELESGLTRQQLLDAMEGHILEQIEIMVKFKR
ncbi:MAG: YbhB/YbcL family Raf kinase inhibitor-like protein [Candidatus Omnitrophica bacterium]|nr:YbhB/YbcL family Raf kinase inhibitor-like protein [Candidatus Omnitrophota bacterium]